jgi:hypothetical protein
MNQPLPAGPDDSITAIKAWRTNNFIALCCSFSPSTYAQGENVS